MQKIVPHNSLRTLDNSAADISLNQEQNNLAHEIDITVDWLSGMLTLGSHAPLAQAQEAHQSRRL
jgi:hypothetical protein